MDSYTDKLSVVQICIDVRMEKQQQYKQTHRLQFLHGFSPSVTATEDTKKLHLKEWLSMTSRHQ